MRRTITMEGLDHFEVDDSGHLFWMGKPVVTEQEIKLTYAVNLSIIATAIATVGMCVVMWLDHFSKALAS